MPLYKSAQLPGVIVEFISVENTNPGDKPTVTFSLTSKNGPLSPSAMDRLRLVITGPNTDYDYYLLEDADSAVWVADSQWAYTFDTPLPMDAAGSFTVGVEGRMNVDVDMGGDVDSERNYAENPSFAFAIGDGTTVPRRIVVDDAKCESCHLNLALHGGNRHDATQYCDSCHRPTWSISLPHLSLSI